MPEHIRYTTTGLFLPNAGLSERCLWLGDLLICHYTVHSCLPSIITTTTAITPAFRKKTLLTSCPLLPKCRMSPSPEIIKVLRKINCTVESYVHLTYMNQESAAVTQQWEMMETKHGGRERDNGNNEMLCILPTIFFNVTIQQRLVSHPHATYCENILYLWVWFKDMHFWNMLCNRIMDIILLPGANIRLLEKKTGEKQKNICIELSLFYNISGAWMVIAYYGHNSRRETQGRRLGMWQRAH